MIQSEPAAYAIRSAAVVSGGVIAVATVVARPVARSTRVRVFVRCATIQTCEPSLAKPDAPSPASTSRTRPEPGSTRATCVPDSRPSQTEPPPAQT